jgi:hypothetical protein
MPDPVTYPITSPALPPIPPPSVPIINPGNGLVTPEWYNFFKGTETLLRLVLAKTTFP